MHHPEPDLTIDLRGQVCPMTFVRTRLALDALTAGQTLMVVLGPGESQIRVPNTVAEQGHTVMHTSVDDDGVMQLVVRKSG